MSAADTRAIGTGERAKLTLQVDEDGNPITPVVGSLLATFAEQQNQTAHLSAIKDAAENPNPVEVVNGVPALPWNYAPPVGGISASTTPVTLKAAAGASLRNYITKLTYAHSTLGNATELALRRQDGTVLYRTILHTTAFAGREITFEPPLFSDENALLEIVTLTSATGNVFVNALGYVK